MPRSRVSNHHPPEAISAAASLRDKLAPKRVISLSSAVVRTFATDPGWPPGGDTVLYCYVHELYDGQRVRPEKLAAWRALRERYGNRDESRVDRGTLLAPAA